MTPLSASDPVRRAVAGWISAYAPDGPVLVAVSGGADSLALALAVRAVAGDRAAAVTVDHGLREGSDAQAGRCAELLRGNGFADVRVLPVTVGTTGGPEAAARDARYAALLETARDRGGVAGPCPVLLGHTLDDQAETVLLGLARGSGPRSIAGMRAWRPPWGRPLLGVRRVDTENACAAAGLVPWDDPQNLDPAFTRVRLRREVLPLLEDVLGGGVAPALARTAGQLHDDLAALDEWADRVVADAVGHDANRDAALDVAAPEVPDDVLDLPPGLPAAVRRRVIRRWLLDLGTVGPTSDHLHRIDTLATAGRDGSSVRLPGGADVVHRAGVLHHLR